MSSQSKDNKRCLHIKITRKKALYQCVQCKSYFTIHIQDDDSDYVWLKKSLIKSEVEKYIESWWHRPDGEKSNPEKSIKNKICQVLCDLDSNIGSIVHLNKKEVEEYVKKIDYTTSILKNWVYVLFSYENGRVGK